MAKLWPFWMPRSGLLPPFTPDSSMATLPFRSVTAVQFANSCEWQEMASAGTTCPCSIRVREVQFCPLSLVKNKVPFPLAGVLKLKLSPTA